MQDTIIEKKAARKKYLTRPKFQLKYCFSLAGVAVIVSLLVGGITWFSFEGVYYQFLNAHYDQSPELVKSLQDLLFINIVNIVVALVLFIIVLMGVGIYMTHRVAGPMTKLTKVMEEISETGDTGIKINFREYDEFQDVAENFNKMVTALSEKKQ